MVPLLRAPLHIIGYGTVATVIYFYNAYQEHGFPVPGNGDAELSTQTHLYSEVFRIKFDLRIMSVKDFWEM